MKNVLIVSDAFLNGGLETRIFEQTSFLNQKDINTHLICDAITKQSKHCPFKNITSGFNFIPNNGKFTAKSILEASESVINYCRENNIDYIDCHPFWCLIPAVIAASKLNIPISYTLHGTASGNFINAIYFEAYLLYYSCLCFGLDQIFAVSERLANLYSYASTNIYISRNSIDINKIPTGKHFHRTNTFATASRLDEPKTEVILNFLPHAVKSKYIKKLDIYGDGDNFNRLSTYIKKHHLSNTVKLRGWSNNLSEQFIKENYDCIFGVGKIITDALSSSTPAGILGYGGFAGLINKDNLNEFMSTNFLSWSTFDNSYLDAELKRLYSNPLYYIFKPKELSELNAESNWLKHLQQMLHTNPSNHPAILYLTELLQDNPNEDLLSHSSIAKAILQIIYNTNPHQLIQLDAVNGFIKLSEQEQATIYQQLSTLQQSTSWKITKPLRKIKDIIKSHR